MEKEESFREELRAKQNALIDLQINEAEKRAKEAGIQLQIAEINLEIAQNKLKVSRQELKEYETILKDHYQPSNNNGYYL